MLELIRRHPQLLLFGMLTAMFSGPGQSFLVSLFIPNMRQDLGMSLISIMCLYALATGMSAFLLPFMGRLLDRIHLVPFTLAAGFLLAAGCLILSQSFGALTVFVGFLLVRNLGQGTLTMISSTTMARIFGSMRGKALGIASLGYPLSEAIFPYTVITWIMVHGWRSGWVMLGALVLLFFSPAVFLLLRDNPQDRVPPDFDEIPLGSEPERNKKGQDRSWTVREMLGDVRFYLLQVPVLIPPAFLTGLFLHQAVLAEWKGWSLQMIALGFIAYAVCRAVLSFMIGPLVDRCTAKRIFPYSLFPLGLGILCLMGGKHVIWGFAYLTGAGLSMGFAMTVTSALWAELYGTKYLGSIRGLQSGLIVFSTALVPPVMAWLLEGKGVNPGILLGGMIGLIAVGILLAWIACLWPARYPVRNEMNE